MPRPRDSIRALDHPAPVGTIRCDRGDPTVMWMSGEVDRNLTRQLRGHLTSAELEAVDVIDLGEVTFADSGLLSVVAIVELERRGARAPLQVRGASAMVKVMLGISNLSPRVQFVDDTVHTGD